MALVEKTKDAVKEKTGENVVRYRVYPDITTFVDYDKRIVEVEIAIPGVKKEDISLKALPTWFRLTARRGDVEYAASCSWGAEIVPEKTKAKYNNGLLKITAYIKDPLADAREIKF